MTADQEIRLLEDVSDMREALLGTNENRQQGIVYRTIQHHDDLNGAEGDHKSGIKYRLRQLEDTQLRMIAWAGGAGGVVAFAVEFIPKLWGHK